MEGGGFSGEGALLTTPKGAASDSLPKPLLSGLSIILWVSEGRDRPRHSRNTGSKPMLSWTHSSASNENVPNASARSS
jgi:hypothetical protein